MCNKFWGLNTKIVVYRLLQKTSAHSYKTQRRPLQANVPLSTQGVCVCVCVCVISQKKIPLTRRIITFSHVSLNPYHAQTELESQPFTQSAIRYGFLSTEHQLEMHCIISIHKHMESPVSKMPR